MCGITNSGKDWISPAPGSRDDADFTLLAKAARPGSAPVASKPAPGLDADALYGTGWENQVVPYKAMANRIQPYQLPSTSDKLDKMAAEGKFTTPSISPDDAKIRSEEIYQINKSPLAALGFDPNRIWRLPQGYTYGGNLGHYRPYYDVISLTTPKGSNRPDVTFHEATHRGISSIPNYISVIADAMEAITGLPRQGIFDHYDEEKLITFLANKHGMPTPNIAPSYQVNEDEAPLYDALSGYLEREAAKQIARKRMGPR